MTPIKESQLANANPAMELIRRTCPEASSPHREVSSNGSDSRSGGTCTMPSAPSGVLTWSGVIVEPGEGSSFYVKVRVGLTTCAG